jgi:Protein of unknown function (DUF3551)
VKASLLLSAIVFGALASGTPAKASNYPWCALYDKGGGEISCGFSTFEQCLEDVRGIGGFCQANNTYVPSTAAPSTHRPKHKSAKHS